MASLVQYPVSRAHPLRRGAAGGAVPNVCPPSGVGFPVPLVLLHRTAVFRDDLRHDMGFTADEIDDIPRYEVFVNFGHGVLAWTSIFLVEDATAAAAVKYKTKTACRAALAASLVRRRAENRALFVKMVQDEMRVMGPRATRDYKAALAGYLQRADLVELYSCFFTPFPHMADLVLRLGKDYAAAVVGSETLTTVPEESFVAMMTGEASGSTS